MYTPQTSVGMMLGLRGHATMQHAQRAQQERAAHSVLCGLLQSAQYHYREQKVSPAQGWRHKQRMLLHGASNSTNRQ
jgi:hypothetical protein